MNMGSLAETYLSAYGWKVYGVIYLVFWVSKIMLYPLVRFTFDLVLDYAAKVDGSPSEPLREGFIRMIVMIMVFILGVVPFVPYDVSSAKITMPGCGQREDALQKNIFDKRFGGGAYVPLLPYAVMLVSSGVNMAILDALPCVSDMIKANQIANNLAMPNTEQGHALKNEATAFNQKCYGPAQEFESANANHSDILRKEVMRQLKKDYFPKSEIEKGVWDTSRGKLMEDDIKKGLDYAGSEYFNKVLYTDIACNKFKPKEVTTWNKPAAEWGNPNFKQADLQEAWNDMCLSITNNRVMTPYAQAATPSNMNSEYQENQGIDGVRCGDWWNGSSGSNGLHKRLAYTGFTSLINQFTATLSSDNSTTIEPTTGTKIILSEYAKNPDGYISDLFNKLDAANKEALVFQMSRSSLRDDQEILSGGQTAVIGGGMLLSVVTSLGGSIGEVGSMVASAMIAKAALKLAHPLLLMMIYSLWLVFLVIGEFKGTTLIKGLLIIFVVKFCTSVFAIADRVSDELLHLLVPNAIDDTWSLIKSSPDIAIIYMVGTLMYLAVPAILMYLVVIAGGPDSRPLSKGAADGGGQVSKTGGKTIGVGAGKGTTLAEGKIKQSAKEARQRYFPKGK